MTSVADANVPARINNLERDYRGSIEYALFKLDDKPHIAWADLLAAAHMSGSPDAIRACEIMLELSLTPETIKKLLKGKKYNGRVL